MKILLTILFIFLLGRSEAQYTAEWDSYGHTIYNIQQSIDTTNWITIGKISAQLTDTAFQYAVPGPTYYYRITADNDISNIVLVYKVLSIDSTTYFKPGNKKSSIKDIYKINCSLYYFGKNIRLSIHSLTYQKLNCKIFNIIGQKLIQEQIICIKGYNIVNIPFKNKGIYIVSLHNDNNNESLEIEAN